MEQQPMENNASVPTGNGVMLQAQEKTMALFAHAGGIFFGFLPALIIWLTKKDESPFIAQQAKEALNFQITVGIAFCACIMLVFVLIGALLIWLVWLADIILSIMAAIKASNGQDYRYPFTLRLLK